MAWVRRIVVGNGSPVTVGRSDVDVRRVPSKRWPTLEAALGSLAPDHRYRIELARGRYRPLEDAFHGRVVLHSHRFGG
jgi:hypothetical protein